MLFIDLLALILPFLAVVKDFTSEVGTPVRQAGSRMVVVVVVVVM
jgi:hypothetical protein